MFDIALFKEIEKEGLESYKLLNLKEFKKTNKKEKEELITLIEELPKLKARNDEEVIHKLIENFIERYPTSLEGYECFTKFYLKIKDYKSALNLIYAALYIDKENGNMLSLLKSCESKLIKAVCKIPIKYKTWILYPETRLYEEGLKKQNNNIINDKLYNENIQIIKHGQYYVALAKRKMLPGEVIFQTKPLILTQYIFAENYTYSTCYHCLKERVKTEKCYSCPINPHTCPYIFCNWECLITNIRIHSAECKILPTIAAAAKEANLMYYSVLHIFRLLIKAGIDKEFKDEEHDLLNEIFDVESYYDSVKENQKEVYESFNTLANRIILEFSPAFYLHLKQKELVELMLILWQYSPFIKYYSPSSIIQYANPETTFGLLYCPTLAKLHHSCIPTCSFNYDENGILTIRALCNIPQGGKLCISILPDQYTPLKIRKNFKGMPRVFDCGCIKCSDPTENNLHLRSMKCPKCIIGYIYPIKTEALIEALKLYRIDKQVEKAEKVENGEKGDTTTTMSMAKNGWRNQEPNRLENGNKNIMRERGQQEGTGGTIDTSQREGLGENTGENIGEGNTNRIGNGIIGDGRKYSVNNIFTENKSDGYFNEQEKKILKKLGGEIERWICFNCGKLSLSGNKRCIKLENKAYLLYNEAEKNYMNGNIIIARKQLLRLYKDFFHIFHPNHYIIFNTNVLLAGLLRNYPNKQIFESLNFLRKAVIAADQVLPICSLEKIHLYLHLADYTFASSNLHKLYNKGAGIPPAFIINPIYTAVWNSCVITGYDSTLTIVLIQRLRMFSIALNLFTPSKNIEYKIEREEEFCNFYYQVTQKKTDTYGDIKKVIDQDYFYPIYMASQCYDLDFEKHKYYKNIFKRFRKIQYFGNGLTALGLAASCGNVKLVKELLKLKYSVFKQNELHMNALLAMASTFLPDEQNVYHSNYYYTLLKEIELQHVDFDHFENNYYYLTDATQPFNAFPKNDNTNHNTNSNNFFNTYNHKNAIENIFHFDITLDEEFIYGEQSRQMDLNQSQILILFMKHLDKIHMKRKKKYKRAKKMDRRIRKKMHELQEHQPNEFAGIQQLDNDRNSDKSKESTGATVSGKWNQFSGRTNGNSSYERLNSTKRTFVDEGIRNKNAGGQTYGKGVNNRGYDRNDDRKNDLGNKLDNNIYNNNIYDNSSITSSSNSIAYNSSRSSISTSSSDSDSDTRNMENTAITDGNSDSSEYEEDRDRQRELKRGSGDVHEFHSDHSEDVLNYKIKNYFTEKLLTKTISHKLLGLNNALHFACARGKRELVKQMIRSGMPVMLLNEEGSTPLHIACFNGHNEIVKVLLKHKSNVNALTCHGESPLMLATFCLHFDVVKTLIENKAEIIVKNENSVTILHCLVYGLLRTHTVYYKNKSSKDDISSLTVQGFNELNSAKYYTQGPLFLNINFVTAQIPIIEQMSHDFFLFPYKLLHRLKKAILILKYLMSYCPIYLYEVKNSHGYNPSELLKVIWKKLCEKRTQVLNISDLRVVAFTEKQRNIIFQAWTLIISLVNMFLSILQPDRSVLTSIYKSFIYSNNANEEQTQKAQLDQGKESQTKALNTKAVDTKAVDTKAVDTKAVDTKAVDTKAVDTKAVDTKAEIGKEVPKGSAENVLKAGLKSSDSLSVRTGVAKGIASGILKGGASPKQVPTSTVDSNKNEAMLKPKTEVVGIMKMPKKILPLKKGLPGKIKQPLFSK